METSHHFKKINCEHNQKYRCFACILNQSVGEEEAKPVENKQKRSTADMANSYKQFSRSGEDQCGIHEFPPSVPQRFVAFQEKKNFDCLFKKYTYLKI